MLHLALKEYKNIIVYDSAVAIEALFYGCNIIKPELKSFVDLSPIVDGVFRESYFTFNPIEDKIKMLEEL